MRVRIVAIASGIALLAACQPTAPKAEEQPVADQPAEPDAPDAFANAVNFDCEGGGKLDVVFENDSPPSVLVRLDGGAPQTLVIDENAASGMIYKDATTTIDLGGDRLALNTAGATKTCTFVSRALPAPTVAGAVRNLTETDAGASIEMKVGEKITVSFTGTPTAGYVWSADAPPAFVNVSEGPGGATTTAQFLPGFAGGNHWEVLIIEGIAPGEGEITLVQKRPWEEKAAPDDARFRFQLKVS